MANQFDTNLYSYSAVKKLNEGLPLNKYELKTLNKLFSNGDYFAHVKFGIETGRLEPEELLYRTDTGDVDKAGFLFLVSFLIKNNLDVNYYLEGPYGMKIHILYYLSTLSKNSNYFNYVVDIFKQAGCNLGSPAKYENNNNKISSKSLSEELNYDPSKLEDICKFDNLDKMDIYWETELRPILLDRIEENIDLFTTDMSDISDLKKTYFMYVMCLTEAKNIIKNLNNKCIFSDEFINMKQSIYFSINSQNYEIFEVLIQKGLICNYTEMTELIFRHNLASEAKDTILSNVYSKMILSSIESGSEIDLNQLRLLSLESSVELVENIKDKYSKPEWEKLCSKTNLSENDIGNSKIRKIAFDLNIDFSLPPYKICEKLEKISNTDRIQYVQASINRQEERVARSLIEVGDVDGEDKIENCRCDEKSMLLNNPYSYNDARMAFYKDESDGKLWCFTSDMFDSLIASKKNPYNRKKLPDLFLETIKSQVNILESLDIKPVSDLRSIGETLETYFDTDREINNDNSTKFYNSFISSYVISTMHQEQDFRQKSAISKELFEKILFFCFYYFVDCENNIPKKNSYLDISFSSGNFFNGYISGNKKLESYIFYKIYKGSKFIKNLKSSTGELFYKNLAYILHFFIKKILKGTTSKKSNYYTDAGKESFVKDLYSSLSLT